MYVANDDVGPSEFPQGEDLCVTLCILRKKSFLAHDILIKFGEIKIFKEYFKRLKGLSIFFFLSLS